MLKPKTWFFRAVQTSPKPELKGYRLRSTWVEKAVAESVTRAAKCLFCWTKTSPFTKCLCTAIELVTIETPWPTNKWVGADNQTSLQTWLKTLNTISLARTSQPLRGLTSWMSPKTRRLNSTIKWSRWTERLLPLWCRRLKTKLKLSGHRSATQTQMSKVWTKKTWTWPTKCVTWVCRVNKTNSAKNLAKSSPSSLRPVAPTNISKYGDLIHRLFKIRHRFRWFSLDLHWLIKQAHLPRHRS